MGRNKKKFIDKKKASTFHLMHRSQRDVAGDIFNEMNEDEIPISSTNMILWPGDNNLPETNKKVLFSSYNADSKQQSEKLLTGTGTNDQHSRMMVWRKKLEEAGLLDDEETSPDKYLKTITGQGIFLDAKSGQTMSIQPQPHHRHQYEEEVLMEVDRMFDSIPVTTDCMDPEIAALLFADDNDEILEQYEELNDDFVFMAAQEPDDEQADEIQHHQVESDFDYDEHIRQLLEKSKRQPTSISISGNKHHPGQEDMNFFAQRHPLSKQSHDDDDVDSWEQDDKNDDKHNKKYHYGHDDEEEYDDEMLTNATSIVPRLSPEEDRALCEKFEQALAEYEEDDDNENEDYNEMDNEHQRPIQGDTYIDAAIDEYLQEKNDDVYMKGLGQDEKKMNKKGGSSFTALHGTTRIRGSDWGNQNDKDQMKDNDDNRKKIENNIPIHIILENASKRLNDPIERPPEEDVLIDGKSYFSERQHNPWDCESILTTYSNLDNNPTIISSNNSRRRSRINRHKMKNSSNDNHSINNDNDPIQPITLSSKTGLPIGVLDHPGGKRNTNDDNNKDDAVDNNDDSTIHTSASNIWKRDKNETNEEKKVRKLLIKQQRSMARIQKKVSKEVYTELYQQKHNVVACDDIAGKTVFRF